MSEAPPVQTKAPAEDTRVTRPIVINRGKQSRSQIEQLKHADGPLWTDVADIVQQVVEQLGADAHGKVVIPVVVVYRKKSRRKRSGVPLPFGT